MTGRTRLYKAGGKPVQVYADIEALECAEKLGLNRSKLFNDALNEFIGKRENTVDKIKAEIAELEHQLIITQGQLAVKKAHLKSAEEKQQMHEEVLVKEAEKKRFCKNCGNTIQDLSTDFGKHQLCKTCYLNHSPELTADLDMLRKTKTVDKRGSIT